MLVNPCAVRRRLTCADAHRRCFRARGRPAACSSQTCVWAGPTGHPIGRVRCPSRRRAAFNGIRSDQGRPSGALFPLGQLWAFASVAGIKRRMGKEVSAGEARCRWGGGKGGLKWTKKTVRDRGQMHVGSLWPGRRQRQQTSARAGSCPIRSGADRVTFGGIKRSVSGARIRALFDGIPQKSDKAVARTVCRPMLARLPGP